MADAIIFDDGGSTRIKRVLQGSAVGAMDSLLDVDDLASGDRGSDHTINDAFTKLMVVCQDKKGEPFKITDTSFNTVEIASAMNQEILIEKVNSGAGIRVTVFSGVTDPIVESKQHKKKRRYVVSNSGPIERIMVDGAVVYNTRPSEGLVLPAGAERPMVYASVVLT
jgi:hypothetical protein